ncbi:MAG TPA: hypothetical protein VIF12_01685 [Micavibrio sp.]
MKRPESSPTPGIDVVESVDYGYRFLWREHAYLMRIAVAPVAIKIICLLVLIGLGWEQNFIRSALVMLPSYLAEGWMLAHLIRLVFYDQRWPFEPTGDQVRDATLLQDRIFGVTGGALFYALIKFLLSGLLAFLAQMQTAVIQTDPALRGEPSEIAIIAAFLILLATLWSFRLIFLYVPASAGIGVRSLILQRRGLLVSIQLMGIWLVSFVPFAMLLLVLTTGLMGGEGSVAVANRFLIVVVQAVCDTLISIVSTMGIALALRKILENQAPSV